MRKFRSQMIALSLLTLSGFLISPPGEAADPKDGCYRFKSTDSPERTEHFKERTEVWCYQSINDPVGALFIYNADEGKVRPELSAIVEPNGTITHASLLAGELTAHKLKGDFNPLPVPLTPPDDAERVSDPSNSFESSTLSTLQFLQAQPTSMADLAVREGQFSAQVSATALPWRGYWWPYSSGRLHNSTSSPLAKYDRFVKARTGYNPGAQAWEKANHYYNDINWEGHCNGWAASSILRSEPRSSRYDSRSGVTFTVSDLKGLLAEKDNCVKFAFFGKRYRGREGDHSKDIYAAIFHNTITYYIGQLKKPIITDYMSGTGVDNHVISGYTMSIKRNSSKTVQVTVTLQMHKYDKSRIEIPAKAPMYKRTYKYNLWTDADGKITGSQWLTANPDFLWVPLSLAQCSPSNPKVTEEFIREIVQRL